jgi:hypothetical protein
MVALRSPHAHAHGPLEERPSPGPADWLTLRQAACELNISLSTARRMARRGFLRNRIVPRRGGFAYLIYLPGSRHASPVAGHRCGVGAAANVTSINGRTPARARVGTADAMTPAANGASARRTASAGRAASEDKDAEIRALREQVDRLAEALARALRVKQRALPPGIGEPSADAQDPYARYRWLVRRARRGWWPF